MPNFLRINYNVTDMQENCYLPEEKNQSKKAENGAGKMPPFSAFCFVFSVVCLLLSALCSCGEERSMPGLF